MSIINDALKKVQSSLRHVSVKNSAENSAPQQPQQPPIQPQPEPAPYTGDTGSNGSSEFAAMAPTPMMPPPETISVTPPPENIAAAAAEKATAVKTAPNAIVYVLGAVCLLIALFAPIVNKQSIFGLMTHKEKTSAAPAAVRAPSRASTPSVAQKAATIKEELTRSLMNFNNPGAGSASTARTPSGKKVVLSGILAQGDKNVALIDGQVYEAGETIDRVKIIAINANNIVIEEGGEQRTLKVGQ